MGFLREIAAFFIGVTLPCLLCLWALIGNDGIRRLRQANRILKDYEDHNGI